MAVNKMEDGEASILWATRERTEPRVALRYPAQVT